MFLAKVEGKLVSDSEVKTSKKSNRNYLHFIIPHVKKNKSYVQEIHIFSNDIHLTLKKDTLVSVVGNCDVQIRRGKENISITATHINIINDSKGHETAF